MPKFNYVNKGLKHTIDMETPKETSPSTGSLFGSSSVSLKNNHFVGGTFSALTLEEFKKKMDADFDTFQTSARIYLRYKIALKKFAEENAPELDHPNLFDE